MKEILIPQIVRTIQQFVYAWLATWGLQELVNAVEFEGLLTGIVTAAFMAAVVLLERVWKWFAKYLMFAKPPSYDQ